MMHEAEDEPLFAERVAGIDIAKAGVEVTIRVPSDTRRGGRQQETRSFRTTRKELLALADWLRCWQVTKVGMESAGDYWKPVFFLLESEGLDCVLYHAAQVKALPGRPKTDLLTELADRSLGWCVRSPVMLARFRPRDQRRGYAAGVVRAGGAAARLA
jgi:transposase